MRKARRPQPCLRQKAPERVWPKGGPHWDALGKHGGEAFLVEAKAHAQELQSGPSRAENAAPVELIGKSLNEVKAYLGVDSSRDWTGRYYQYANRIAHLYYLRVLNNIDAYLAFVY
jgi:hypothetical protein